MPKSKPRLREKDNVVAAFVGTLKSKQALAKYLDEDDHGGSPFSRDLGVDLTSVEFIEQGFSKPAAPGKIVEGHVGWEDYADKLTAVAKQHGVTKANTAITILDRTYSGEVGATFADGALTFVGNFPYEL